MFGQSICYFQSTALFSFALPITLIAKRLAVQLVRVASSHLALTELDARLA